MTDQRRLAHRLWLGGFARKRIAEMLDVTERTIKTWSYRDGWPARRGNHSEHRDPETYRPKCFRSPPQEGTGEDRPICWVCGGAAPTWDGHPQCRGRNWRAA